MKRPHYITILPIALAVIVGTGSLKGAPAIYEPFDYEAGDLDGASGASEVGLAGDWIAHTETNRSTEVIATGLTYGLLQTSGGSVLTPGLNINRFSGARAVDAAALAGNGLLDDGATLWFSMLGGFDATNTGAGQHVNGRLGFALANDRFNPANFRYNIVDDGAQLGSGLGVSIGTLGANSLANAGAVYATHFRDLAAGNGVSGNENGTFTGSRLAVGEVGFIVGKIVWGAATDTIELYQPDENLNLGSVISTLSVDVDQSVYDTITFSRGNEMILDEIRFGSSLADVMPQQGAVPFTTSITKIEYAPGLDTVTLTWTSSPEDTYIVEYSSDMTDWSFDMGDDITMAKDDENTDDGDHLTMTFSLAEFLVEDAVDLFFRVDLN